jgi:hypothetical protein
MGQAEPILAAQDRRMEPKPQTMDTDDPPAVQDGASELPSGARPRLDPRSSKQGPAAKPAQAKSAMKSDTPNQGEPHEKLRNELTQRQELTAQQLADTRQQLDAPREQIAQLKKQLSELLGLDTEQAAELLAQMLASTDMRQALRTAQAMHQSQAGGERPDRPDTRNAQAAPPSRGASALPASGLPLNLTPELVAADLDLAAQAVILRMQPRLREELLKGMREEGPEAYRKFIQDYFQRLTRVKSAP